MRWTPRHHAADRRAVRAPRQRRVDRPALSGVAWIGMELFTSRPAGDAMAVTIWGSASSWTLTALPLFVWMGEILFRTRLSEDMFRGWRPGSSGCPGGCCTPNMIGCTIFAAVSARRAATCATIGKMTLPELSSAATRRDHDRLARRRRHAGPADPALDHHDRLRRDGADVSIAQLFIAGVIPGIAAGGAVLGLHRRVGARATRSIPPADRR